MTPRYLWQSQPKSHPLSFQSVKHYKDRRVKKRRNTITTLLGVGEELDQYTRLVKNNSQWIWILYRATLNIRVRQCFSNVGEEKQQDIKM